MKYAVLAANNMEHRDRKDKSAALTPVQPPNQRL